MTIITREMPSFSNVAAGSNVSLNCATGKTYHNMRLTLGGTTFTIDQLTNIEVLLNGKVVQSFSSGTQLAAINAYYGVPDSAGMLTLWFARPWMDGKDRQRSTAFGTADIRTMQIRAKIAAGAVAPTLTATAEIGPASKLGKIIKFKSYGSNHAVTGEVDVDTIPRGNIVAIHNEKADISHFRMEVDDVVIADVDKTILEEAQTAYGRVPQTATHTHWDGCLDGAYDTLLPATGSQDFRLRPTLDSSGAIVHLVEYLDDLAGL